MVVGGIPPNTEGHAERCMEFALEAIRFVGRYNEEHQFNLRLRVGICAGPVVAGVIGQTRYNLRSLGRNRESGKPYGVAGTAQYYSGYGRDICTPGIEIQVFNREVRSR